MIPGPDAHIANAEDRAANGAPTDSTMTPAGKAAWRIASFVVLALMAAAAILWVMSKSTSG